MTTPDDVLDFWFPADSARANKLWWGKDAGLDAEIRERFAATLAAASAGELDGWVATARGRLALIVVLDQLSRNIHRDHADAYAADAQAREHSLAAIAAGQDLEIAPERRLFVYLPLEHSEELADQERCVELFRGLAEAVAREPEVTQARRELFANYVKYAVAHRDIVARFGRFPHRNALLGRASTDEEREFLTQPGSSF